MRYEKQLFFKYIGKEGQDKIRKSTVTIVGVGALGSVSAELLSRAGIGKLILIDSDKIEIHNLQRQSLFDEKDIGKSKVEVAKSKISKINSEVEVESHNVNLDKYNLDLIQGILVDGTDNMEVRDLMNKYCVSNNLPWVYGGIASSVGMVYFTSQGRACFNCIFNKVIPGITCEGEGVLNTIAYTIASLQVTNVLRYIVGEEIENSLIRVNVWNSEFEKIKISKKENCEVCGENTKKQNEITTNKKNKIINKTNTKKYNQIGKQTEEQEEGLERFIINKCKTKAAYSVRTRKQDKIDLKKAKKLLLDFF